MISDSGADMADVELKSWVTDLLFGDVQLYVDD